MIFVLQWIIKWKQLPVWDFLDIPLSLQKNHLLRLAYPFFKVFSFQLTNHMTIFILDIDNFTKKSIWFSQSYPQNVYTVAAIMCLLCEAA